MNKQFLSGILLIIGFLLFVVSGFLFPMPNLWRESDIDVRMQIVVIVLLGGISDPRSYLM
jgi:hypothetical protein